MNNNLNKVPLVVATGDVHFKDKTMSLARTSVMEGLRLAERLGVPFLINGDLLDNKNNINAKCANALIEIFQNSHVETYVNVGNHDRLSEKDTQHSLNFLKPYVNVIDEPTYVENLNAYIVPYQNSSEELENIISKCKKSNLVFMHQGIKGAHMGDYIVDKTSVDTSKLGNLRVILSHYHKAQDIGNASFLGSPYTISFTEANDGPKGIQIVYTDGSLELVPLSLRKHVIIERTIDTVFDSLDKHIREDDVIWLKVKGMFLDLQKLSKKQIGQKVIGHMNFKYDPIPTDEKQVAFSIDKLSNTEILDKLIDTSQESDANKTFLKTLYREIM